MRWRRTDDFALSSYSAEAQTSYLTLAREARSAPGLVRSKYSIGPPAIALSGRISRRPGSHGDRPRLDLMAVPAAR
jgi:hypothetical protein